MNIQKFIEKTKKKLMKVQDEINLEEAGEIINELNVLLDQLNAVSESKKSDKLFPSEIAELIRTTPLIDINGSKCFPDDVSVSGNSISIWYCDPGEWEEDEDSDGEDEILTVDSIAVIKSFLKGISPQVDYFSIEDYHLADVKITISIK